MFLFGFDWCCFILIVVRLLYVFRVYLFRVVCSVFMRFNRGRHAACHRRPRFWDRLFADGRFKRVVTILLFEQAPEGALFCSMRHFANGSEVYRIDKRPRGGTGLARGFL